MGAAQVGGIDIREKVADLAMVGESFEATRELVFITLTRDMCAQK